MARSARASDQILEHAEHPAEPSRSAPGGRLVIVYLLIAVVCAIPGLLLRAGWSVGQPPAAHWLKSIAATLEDIRFGSGARFWMGVAGATMMALLLLYPLRKSIGGSHWLGRIGGWFQIHMLFGIGGPVLVLYHANFGHGSMNANVALWSMLAIFASGLVGHFVYGHASATFYSRRQQAQIERDGVSAALLQIDALPLQRQRLIEELEAFDAELLTPHRGIVASMLARLQLERRRRQLALEISSHLSACSDAIGLTPAAQQELRRRVALHFGAYIGHVRRASSRSVREQLWARWRLFHLPVFLLMVVAASLHVAAVWNMDGPDQPQTEMADATVPAVAPLPSARPESAPKQADAAALAVKRVIVQSVPQSTAPASSPTRAQQENGAAQPVLVTPPRIVHRSRPPAVQPQVAQARPSGRPETAAPASPAPPAITEVYAELERRDQQSSQQSSQQSKMSLGLSSGQSLADQIATLKAKRAAGQFAHSDAETGFALIGHHQKAECASCHTKPLAVARSPNPRTCISCHKEDDVHRGRRPACANCHTPRSWGEILRRR